MDGYRVAFRKGGKITWARQGPESHKRTTPFGVLLSAISGADEHTDMAKKIDRAKFIYLAKSGGDHPTYASFHHYKLPLADNATCLVGTQPASDPSRFVLAKTALTTRSLRALNYGGRCSGVTIILVALSKRSLVTVPNHGPCCNFRAGIFWCDSNRYC